MAPAEKCKFSNDNCNMNIEYLFFPTKLKFIFFHVDKCQVDSCLENSTFLAGEQKTAADILLFHGLVQNIVLMVQVSKFSIQDPQCCVETGFSRKGALHSLKQVRSYVSLDMRASIATCVCCKIKLIRNSHSELLQIIVCHFRWFRALQQDPKLRRGKNLVTFSKTRLY